jgi:hypothetical protein
LAKAAMLGERLGGQNHPAVLLRAGIRALGPRRVDGRAGFGDRVGRQVAGGGIGLGDKRQHGGGVAQLRAVVRRLL